MLGLGGVFAACKPRRRPQLRTHHLGIRARRSLWRRRWSARLVRQRLALHQQLHFVGVDDFPFEQRLGDALKNVSVVREDVLGLLVAAVNDALHFLVDLDGGVFRIIAMLRDFAAEEDGFIFLAVSQRTQLAHAPSAAHVRPNFGGSSKVVAPAGGVVTAKNSSAGAASKRT